MNFKENETKEKLNGTYYTPPQIADFISHWIGTDDPKNILEPSCGNGVFIEALSHYINPEMSSITICDIDNNAIEIAYKKAKQLNYKDIYTINEDFIEWAYNELSSSTFKKYDAILGNPPFVRYQYMEKEIQGSTQKLYKKLGLRFSKHTNLWVAFVMAALAMLDEGGKFAMVIPEEIISVIYAEEARKVFEEQCSKFIIIAPHIRIFENTLQGFVVLLAIKKQNQKEKTQHAIAGIYDANAEDDIWKLDPVELFENIKTIQLSGGGGKWTKMFLSEEQQMAYKDLQSHSSVYLFSDLAKVEVGIVTGANNYFLVTDEVVKEYGLEDIVKPMFGRSTHCPGVIFDRSQLDRNRSANLPVNFVCFDDNADQKYSSYIKYGESLNIDQRYKCRIRSPWYIVPSLFTTNIAMPKRSSDHPRLVYNDIGAYTTDTAYRVTTYNNIDPISLVTYFQNSITALSAEIEGRYYGGGVLELVPSEIRKLSVPYSNKNLIDLNILDSETRELPANILLKRQDERLAICLGLPADELEIVHEAWKAIASRRQSFIID